MYWEEEYIHILIERNLVDVLALLASIEARDETSALVDTPTRIEARHETRCEEATSTSLHSKKKEARKIEPPQINNECIEKALIQLTGVVKCILVVLVFFGLAFLVKIIVGVRAKRRSIWVGKWGRVRAISRMLCPCAQTRGRIPGAYIFL